MIIVDARCYQRPMTGVGRFIDELLRRAVLTSPSAMLGVAKAAARLPQETPLRVVVRGPDIPDAVWNECRLTPLLRSADAYLAPTGQVPWTAPSRCKVVSVIHDLVHDHPEAVLSLPHRLSRENAVRASVRRADVIVCTTSAVSDELEHTHGRPADALISGGTTVPPSTEAGRLSARRLLAVRPDVEQWALAVGPEIPRKNYVRLAQSLAQLPGVGLIIAGGRADPDVGRQLDVLGRDQPIIRPGFVEQELLAGLWDVVDALAYPSLAEGLGLPLLDARARGLPVLVADREPMRTIAGPGSVAVDPLRCDALAAGVREVLLRSRAQPDPGVPLWADGVRTLQTLLGMRVMS